MGEKLESILSRLVRAAKLNRGRMVSSTRLGKGLKVSLKYETSHKLKVMLEREGVAPSKAEWEAVVAALPAKWGSGDGPDRGYLVGELWREG